MANNNPISITDTGKYPAHVISAMHADKNLFLTTKTSLVDGGGWKLDLQHTVSIAGDSLDFDPDPDIISLDLGKCSDLDNNRLALVSIAARLRDGGDLPAPEVLYEVSFHADDELIDVFSISSKKNPITFYTKVTLKLES